MGSERQIRSTSAVDLTFASAYRRVLKANVKSKTALELCFCSCPSGPDIRKGARRNMMRISGPGHEACIAGSEYWEFCRDSGDSIG
jgi:hypothetical protein